MAWLLKTYRYDKLPPNEDGTAASSSSWLYHAWQRGRIHILYISLLVVVAAFASHGLSLPFQQPSTASPQKEDGEYFGTEPTRSTIQLKTHPHVFVLNETFALPPSPATNAAWASLLPKKGGFFTHPTLAPKISCLAVFHQIHCLDMLRQALYEGRSFAVDGSALGHNSHADGSTGSGGHGHKKRGEEKRSKADEDNHDHSMWHLGHCFDLIRQTLMCRPDVTVEEGDVEIGGVTGFGTEHQCVDWAQLMGWMEEHE